MATPIDMFLYQALIYSSMTPYPSPIGLALANATQTTPQNTNEVPNIIFGVSFSLKNTYDKRQFMGVDRLIHEAIIPKLTWAKMA